MEVAFCDLQLGDIIKGFGGVKENVCLVINLVPFESILLKTYNHHIEGEIVRYLPYNEQHKLSKVFHKEVFKSAPNLLEMLKSDVASRNLAIDIINKQYGGFI